MTCMTLPLHLNKSFLPVAHSSSESELMDGHNETGLLYLNGYNTSHSNYSGETVDIMTSVEDKERQKLRKDMMLFESRANFLRSIPIPAICLFGMLGNLLSLLVLTRKRIKSSCDGTERSVHIGLISLAVSDFLICFCTMPYGFLFKKVVFDYPSLQFDLIFKTYGHVFVNTFVLISTWLTVTMATSRYLAIVHPFKARPLVGMTGTRTSIIIVWFSCVLFNIPRIFEDSIQKISCPDGSIRYFKISGSLEKHPTLKQSYIWLYFTFGICLPLMILAFCNICLVKALWSSAKLRKRYRVPAAHIDANYRITSILVTIVVMYILLVSPAEILRFFKARQLEKEIIPTYSLLMAIETTNVLQSINFSSNFVLYIILNVHFRQAMKDICCPCRRRSKPKTTVLQVKKTFSRGSLISKQAETSQTRI